MLTMKSRGAAQFTFVFFMKRLQRFGIANGDDDEDDQCAKNPTQNEWEAPRAIGTFALCGKGGNGTVLDPRGCLISKRMVFRIFHPLTGKHSLVIESRKYASGLSRH